MECSWAHLQQNTCFFNCAGKAKAVAKPAKNPAPAVSKQGHKTNPAFLHGFKQLKGLFKVKIWLSSADGNIQKLFTSVSFTQNWCKVSSVLLWGKEVSFIYLQTRAPLLTQNARAALAAPAADHPTLGKEYMCVSGQWKRLPCYSLGMLLPFLNF